MSSEDRVALSKTVAHALRHAPWQYELEPDEEGWVPIPALLEALRRGRWHNLSQQDLEAMIQHSDKRRYETGDGRIRALYGHSLPGRLAKVPHRPPDTLYHGTSRRVMRAIRESGLLPMGRQYVHLSTDMDTAMQVARRKAPPRVILRVAAHEAFESGVRFYSGNDRVWLADAIPPPFLSEDDAR